MGLPSCRHCGKSDPRRMVGLMTLWFGPFIDLEPAHGYFYLCPTCYRTHVAPHLEEIQDKLARLHPSTAALMDHDADPEAGEDAGVEGGEDAESGPDTGVGERGMG